MARRENQKEVVLPFKTIVEGVVDTDPNFLNFGLVQPKQTKRLTFRIINRSGKQLRLRLKSLPKLVKVEPITEDGLEWATTLSVPDTALPSQILSGKIVFTTGISVQPNLEIPFFAAVEIQSEREGAKGGTKYEPRR